MANKKSSLTDTDSRMKKRKPAEKKEEKQGFSKDYENSLISRMFEDATNSDEAKPIEREAENEIQDEVTEEKVETPELTVEEKVARLAKIQDEEKKVDVNSEESISEFKAAKQANAENKQREQAQAISKKKKMYKVAQGTVFEPILTGNTSVSIRKDLLEILDDVCTRPGKNGKKGSKVKGMQAMILANALLLVYREMGIISEEDFDREHKDLDF